MKKVLIVGIGNAFRSDDAVGMLVIQQLREFGSADVAVIEQSGEGTALLNAWIGYAQVILIDAVSSGSAPGTVHRIDLREETDLSRYRRGFSGHDFGVPGAVAMGRALGKLPPKLLLLGIEGSCFSVGIDLSPEVLAAVPTVTKLALREISNWQGSTEIADSRASFSEIHHLGYSY
jgi:hydrogenase maturation protease